MLLLLSILILSPTTIDNNPTRALRQENEGDDSEEFGPLAAYGCLRALSTVLDTVSSLPHLIPQLEAIVFPVLKRLVSSEGQDVLEEVMELLAYFTYYSPVISPEMWSIWSQVRGSAETHENLNTVFF